MPIQVSCPSCKAVFSVPEKFAGKQGPCPKCKTVITVPKPAAEVKIHAPEGAEGGKDTKRSLVTKPILREETKLNIPLVAIGAIVVIGVFVGAYFLRTTLQGIDLAALAMRAAGLLVIAFPATILGYAVLRDQELEPYRGRAMLVRTTLCSFLYAGLWVAFYHLPSDFLNSIYTLLIVAALLIAGGAAVAFVSYDLDFGNGLFHYIFYLLVSLALAWVAGVNMPWGMLRS
ncbi:MAG: hypothetical protein JSS27_00820 [Planctomycetes bacterium]|nr:hypothetical protein [Planctomycetota bacterium]